MHPFAPPDQPPSAPGAAPPFSPSGHPSGPRAADWEDLRRRRRTMRTVRWVMVSVGLVGGLLLMAAGATLAGAIIGGLAVARGVVCSTWADRCADGTDRGPDRPRPHTPRRAADRMTRRRAKLRHGLRRRRAAARSRASSCWSGRRRRASRTWAAEQFAPDEIVSSDRLRAVVGHGEDDLDATADAFALLDTIVEHRLARRLTTVVDTLGLDDDRRRRYREQAAAHGVPCVVVASTSTPRSAGPATGPRPAPCRPPPSSSSSVGGPRCGRELDDEGFDLVLRPEPVRHVAEHLALVGAARRRAARADRSACGSACTSRPSRGTTSPAACGPRSSRPSRPASTACG